MKSQTNNDIKINLRNPKKLLWPEMGITKEDYINLLMKLSPYLLPHTQDRILTVIRYPDNIHEKAFYQKSIPSFAPSWIDKIIYKSKEYINLNKIETLLWLGNLGALEFHIGFNKLDYNKPSYLVFDLDPSEGQCFDQVIEVALIIKEELKKLSLNAYAKTSGASGIQMYMPIVQKYTYEEGRKINTFFAKYFSQKYPKLITIERSVKKRDHLLYFDYLQMWEGKTIASVYSPRAVKSGAISTPVTWKELEKGCQPSDFNLLNIIQRLEQKGDLFNLFIDTVHIEQDLEFIMDYLSLRTSGKKS